MTDQELRDLVAENARAIRESDKNLKKLAGEVGWFGNSLGRFTESLFTPSLDRILVNDFGLDTVAHRVRRKHDDAIMEIDVLGYSNSEKNTAVVVEIKSRLRDEDIKNFLTRLKKFPKIYTEHKGKKILGMMAAVTLSVEQRAKLEKNGIYVVLISDEVFRIVSDKKFRPHDFGMKE